MVDASTTFANARKVIQILKHHGHEAYLVGGCVRDLVMGIQSNEYDIATSAKPDEIQAIFRKTIPVGAAFGVIIVRIGGADFEVATFRSDGHYIDGRHPTSVTFTSSKEDVLRRDFTINGLLYDTESGEIIDYVNGEADIKAGIVRAIGNPRDRLMEDKLRMLRAIRFAARLQFSIENKTYQAITDLNAFIHEVSAERICMELTKILVEGGAKDGFLLLDDTGLLQQVLPEISQMKGIAQPPNFHPEGDVFQHTMKLLGLFNKPTMTLAWGALLHDVGKPQTMVERERITFYQHDKVGAEIADGILKRLRFSKVHREQIRALVFHHLHFINVKRMRLAKLKRFLRMDHFAEHLELHRLDCLASHGKLDNYEFCKEKLDTLEDVRQPQQRLLNGSDLIASGYRPGPLFKRILTAIEDEQLENRIATKEAAIAFVHEHFPRDTEEP